MALVKEEYDSDSESSNGDKWLALWANSEEETIKKEEVESKETLMEITDDISEEDGLEKPVKHERMKGDIVENSKSFTSSKTRNEYNEEGKEDTHEVQKETNKSKRKVKSKKVSNNSMHLAKNESLLEEAEITDKVENLCKFQCPKCAVIFMSRTSIYQHFRKTKHADTSKGEIYEYLTDIVAHKCRICSKKILCDRTIIGNHALSSHNLTSVKEYSTSLSRFAMRHSLLNKARTTASVANLCKYQCPKCFNTYESTLALRKHFRKTKHAVATKLLADNCLIDVVAHKCHICSEKILCDKNIIKNHLMNHHKGTIFRKYSEDFSFLAVRDSLVENAKLSDSVENLCTYQCPKCEKVFESRLKFGKHLKQSKHAIYSGDVVDKYLKDVVAHKCQICSTKILCEKGTIQKHMSYHHNITMTKYCNKMNLELDSYKSKKNKDIVELVTKISSRHKMVNQLGNFCKFSCPKCEFVCNNYKAMKVHIRKKEHGPLLSYTKYFTSVIFHKCHVCDELVPNDIDIFFRHIQVQHKMTLPNYRKRLSLPNIDEQGSQYISKLKTAIKDIPIVQPQTRRTLETNSLSVNQVTKDVGNLSFFKCPVCFKPNLNFATLVHHCKKAHQGRQLLYNKEHVVEARYHRCFICTKIVLCDNATISSHVHATHRVILSSYIKDYVLKGGGKVFPTFKDYCRNNQIFEIIKA